MTLSEYRRFVKSDEDLFLELRMHQRKNHFKRFVWNAFLMMYFKFLICLTLYVVSKPRKWTWIDLGYGYYLTLLIGMYSNHLAFGYLNLYYFMAIKHYYQFIKLLKYYTHF
ncbi:hypothetical protein FGO68_gene13280 [Halteria grandinella]|uniref:Uncharacterized protein n=1 Tax=Halteria grandinella TaxID=5974 RepID=A0A8J8NJA4_HALGN|nr:hypothetical protein FGO68_gene13280 [Halteria grandinella]